MKRSAIIRIILFALLALVLIGLLAVGILAGRGLPSIHFPVSMDGEPISAGSLPAEQVRELEIHWYAGQVNITAADVETVQFSSTESSRHPTQYRLDGAKLNIYFTNKFSFSHREKDLEILVPRTWSAQKIALAGASLKAVFTDIQGAELEIDGASNGITVKNGSFGQVEVDGASNDIYYTGRVRDMELDGASAKLDLNGELETLDVDGVSAQIHAVLTGRPRDISMDGVSGTLELTLPKGLGFRADLDGLSSRFSAQQDTRREDGEYVHGDGSCRIRCDGVSARLDIFLGEE